MTHERLTIDLHLHTNCSDGVLTPGELFDAVRSAGLAYFSVTEHDNMASYPVPDDLRARCISGMEVDSELRGHTVHILAYGIDPQSPLVETLEAQRRERLERMAFIVEKLRGMGYPIELGDVLAQAGSAASLGRPHLARALVARGIVASVQDAFDRFLADGGPAFVPLKRSSSERIIELIHESDGVAVVAHPKRLRDPADLGLLLAAGVDGIEVAHPTASEADRLMYADIARAHDLLLTGGTDFHAPGDCGVMLGVDFARGSVERLVAAIAPATV